MSAFDYLAVESTEAASEARSLLAQGLVRDALRHLMRFAPDELPRQKDTKFERPIDPSSVSLQLGICYGLLGMDRDALEWCWQAEREAVASPSKSQRMAEIRCLRLWITVLDDRLNAAIEPAEVLFMSTGLTPATRALGIAALMVLAMKADHLALARKFADLPRASSLAGSLGSAVLDWCSAELSFREIVASLPQFEGALERQLETKQADEGHTVKPIDRLYLLAAELEDLEGRLHPWPLLQEMTATLRAATRLLLSQLHGQLPQMGALELRVGAFGQRGLVLLHRHGRFFLALLNLHQGRSATAEGWLRDGSPLTRWINRADVHELLLAANGRGQIHDWANAFLLYRAYVQLASRSSVLGEGLASLYKHMARNPLDTVASTSADLSHPVDPPAKVRVPQRVTQHQGSFGSAKHAPVSSKRMQICQRTAAAVRDLVQSDLTRPLLVSEIAAHLGVARRTVENRVRQESGRSVKHFVTDLRLAHAFRLINEQNDVNGQILQSIALHAGFSSYRSFCAAYTKKFGHLPHKRGRLRAMREGSVNRGLAQRI